MKTFAPFEMAQSLANSAKRSASCNNVWVKEFLSKKEKEKRGEGNRLKKVMNGPMWKENTFWRG